MPVTVSGRNGCGLREDSFILWSAVILDLFLIEPKTVMIFANACRGLFPLKIIQLTWFLGDSLFTISQLQAQVAEEAQKNLARFCVTADFCMDTSPGELLCQWKAVQSVYFHRSSDCGKANVMWQG